MFHGARRMDLVRQVIYYGMNRAALIGIVLGAIFYFNAEVIISVFTDDTYVIVFWKRLRSYIGICISVHRYQHGKWSHTARIRIRYANAGNYVFASLSH